MSQIKRKILLTDSDLDEVYSFAEALGDQSGTFEVRSYIANWKRTGKISEIKRYAKYFGVGFLSFLRRGQYDVIVGWQQFYALIYCFFCQLFRVKKANTVIALNFTYKAKSGKLAGIYRWFMSKCLSIRYLDYIHVPSEAYADAVSAEFDYPRERIIVTPFGINDQYEEFAALEPPAGYGKEGYALSIGRSNRDFDFLIRAWEGIDYPLVIISDTYKGSTEAKHIQILSNVAGEESYPWIANCSLMVVPIDDGTICSGDTVLLTAMSVARRILVTVPSAIAQMYIVDGENALLTEKRQDVFRQKVMEALYSDECRDMGQRARCSFLQNYSRESMGREIARYVNL